MNTRIAIAGTSLALFALTGCTDNASDSEATTIQVRSTDDACVLSKDAAPESKIVFKVTNDGSDVTEVYFLRGDGKKVVGEVENIGPGISRNLSVEVDAGDYFVSCKPGMTGDGIKTAFTVTK